MNVERKETENMVEFMYVGTDMKEERFTKTYWQSVKHLLMQTKFGNLKQYLTLKSMHSSP